jgi:hypothetical protein
LAAGQKRPRARRARIGWRGVEQRNQTE